MRPPGSAGRVYDLEPPTRSRAISHARFAHRDRARSRWRYGVELIFSSSRGACRVRPGDIHNAWDRHEPLKPSRTAPRGAWPRMACIGRVGAHQRSEGYAPRGAVFDGFDGSGRSQAFWISTGHTLHGRWREYDLGLTWNRQLDLARSRMLDSCTEIARDRFGGTESS